MTHKTMIIRTIAAGMLLSPLAACNPAPEAKPADTAKVTDEVKARIADIIDGYNHKNLDKAIAVDAPDIVGMYHGAPNIVGPDADRKVSKPQVDDPNVKLTVSNENYDVAASGDMAVYRSTYSFTITDPKTKKPVTEVGNWVAGFKRQADGSMKLAWNVISDTPAPKPAAK